MNQPMWTTTINTPLGGLRAFATAQGLRAILWPEQALADEFAPAQSSASQPTLHSLALQLGEYFAGARRGFDLPLDPVGTQFQRMAWAQLQRIPFGKTQTYGAQAAAIGRPNAARAVGAANGRNPLSIVVPCHRVVSASGSLTGFAGGVQTKAWLLDHERRVLAGG